MTRSIVDNQIDVTKPDGTTFTVGKNDILSVQLTEKLQSRKDTGSFTISNENGKYSPSVSGNNGISTGDKLEYKQKPAGGTLSTYWTAVARPPAYNSPNNPDPFRTITVEAEDFVFGVMNWRTAFNSFEDTQIAGTSSSILNTLINNNASEIGTSQIGSFTKQIDYAATGKKLFSNLQDIENIADALAYNNGTDLVFEKISGISTKFSVERGKNGDVSIYTVDSADDQLRNEVRVDGGTGIAIDDQQTTQSSTTTITESSRFQEQVNTRKSELDQIAVYTSKTGSNERITLRLQKDDGGSPIAPNDETSDIVKRRLPADLLTNGGFTTFLLPSHTLPEPNPWIILQTNGSTGQDVGTDGNGNLTYKAYYPYPLIVRTNDQGSIDKYRRREQRVTDDNLNTIDEAKELAQSKLRHNDEPINTVNIQEGLSDRMHDLNVGEAVDLDWPEDNAVGEYIVRNKTTTIESGNQSTSLTLQEVGSL